MSDTARPDSTMTKLMRSSAEDAILHRALTLPTRFPGKIILADSDGRSIETKYVFDSAHPIGEGGTAVVYRVRDTQLNVVRALKVLLLDLRSDLAAETRWRRERELLLALEKVDAPCVPTIYDVGIADGLPVIVMQYVDGITLSNKLLQLNQPGSAAFTGNNVDNYLRFITGVVSPLASSLAHIEKHFAGTEHQGFAHGDIKPSNIIIEPKATESASALSLDAGRVWLLDFGEASVRDVGDARGLTPAYSSPEQLTDWASQRSPQVTAATDQYQLGVVLQELLRPIESYGNRRHWRLKSISVTWQIRRLSKIAKTMTGRRPADRFVDFHAVSKAFQQVESLPRRRVIASAVLVGTIAMILFLSLLSMRGPVESRDARPMNPQFVATSVENEWNRWQEPQFWGATQPQLDAQLASQVEQWRSSYGKDTADAVTQELRRRLSLLSGGHYVFRILSAIPDDQFNQMSQQFPDQSPDAVTVTLSVNEIDVAKLHGKIVPLQPIMFDATQATFLWKPGQTVQLSIRTETKSDRQKRERRDKDRQAHDEAVKRYEAAQATGERVLPPPPFIDFPDVAFSVGIGGNHTNGGVMAIPAETKCLQVEDHSLLGKFDDYSLNWDIEITPIQ